MTSFGNKESLQLLRVGLFEKLRFDQRFNRHKRVQHIDNSKEHYKKKNKAKKQSIHLFGKVMAKARKPEW